MMDFAGVPGPAMVGPALLQEARRRLSGRLGPESALFFQPDACRLADLQDAMGQHVLFVDLHSHANWAHDCLYVLVRPHGEWEVELGRFPPAPRWRRVPLER